MAAGGPVLAQEKGALPGRGDGAPVATPREARPAADPVAEAAKLYAEGVNAARAKQWEIARAAFLESFKRRPDARTAANLGKVELIAGKPRDAAEHLSFFLREAQDISEPDRQKTVQMLAEAMAEIGTVTVRVDTEGAEVLVDGQKVGTSPFASLLFMDPGSRRIEARKAGFTSASKKIDVSAGSALAVKLALAPVPPQVIASVPRPGPRREAPPEPSAPGWRTWGIVSGVGLAVVGAGVGIGFSIAARAKDPAVFEERERLTTETVSGNEICPHQGNDARCQTLAEHMEAQDTYEQVALAAFVVGGAAAAGAVVSALWKPSRPGRSAGSAGKEAAFSIVPSHQGVAVMGSF